MPIRRMINMGQRRQRAAVAATERDHNHNDAAREDKIQTIIEEGEESEKYTTILTSPKKLTSPKSNDDEVNNDNNNVFNNTDLTPRKRDILDRNKKRIKNSNKSSTSNSSRRSKKSDSNGSSSKTNRSGTNHERKKKTTRTTTNNNTTENSNNNNRRKQGEQREIHWNPKVEKKRHIMLRDMTDEERDSVWYGGNDTKIILGMAKVTVRMMMKGEVCDDIDYCSRGLEGKTVIGSKKRSKNKSVVRRAVLTEQEIQRMDGVIDPEQLAKSSYKYTKAVNDTARDYAIQNEQDIIGYLNDVRKLLNIHSNKNSHLQYRTE
jgi:hypothetical protein